MGSYPPRECGIATFTQDLLQSCQQYLGSRIECKAAAFNLTSSDTYKYPREVEWQIDQNSKKAHIYLAHIVNNDKKISGVILQHEYGIFGGKEGENILSFMQNCKKPILITLHTVIPIPSKTMKEVTKKIIELATTIIVLTNSSKTLIEKIYPSSCGKIFVIPHGIHPVNFSISHKTKIELELKKYTILSTFGLLSRGKGIEYAINALPDVIKNYPSVLYLILGETHPVVVRNEGEKYRIKLLHLIAKLRLQKHVRFYDQYLSLPELFDFLHATDIYISSSINPNQAVSGTLSYALGSGRAVISTQFAQAKEIVTPETGRLVPIKNSSAIKDALIELLQKPKLLKQMHLKAYQTTRNMLWSNVAKQYISLLERIVIPNINITHLRTMTDDFGLFQFARFNIPNHDFGYALDDNARAAIVCSWLAKQTDSKELQKLITIYIKFINKCQQKNGSFSNYIGYYDKKPTIQNQNEDLEDTQMRTFWALSEVAGNDVFSKRLRNQAKHIFLLKLKNLKKLTHLRAQAYAIKAFALAEKIFPDQRLMLVDHIKTYADSLINSLKKNSDKSWFWFEDHLSYNNGLLPESLFIAGQFTDNLAYKDRAIATLTFLIGKTFSNNTYMPIGQSNWYKKNKKRSEYDQQPEDPASMILALVCAYRYTHNTEYKKLAEQCFGWFLGKNNLNISLYNKKTGGCYDGLHSDRVNLNQGAESLVCYLMSNLIMRQLN